MRLIIVTFILLLISCKNNEKLNENALFELTLKDSRSIKLYKMMSDGLFLNLVNKPGEFGVLWEGNISSDRYKMIDDFLNINASFIKDTTINSWNSAENCSDEPLYRLIYHNKYNKEIVFIGSSCIKHSAMDSFVFSTILHLDSVEKRPYFNSFEHVVPPPSPF